MARFSEFEQSGADTIEVAISADEYAQLADALDPLELRLTFLNADGSDRYNELLSTNQADWALDADTGEYFLLYNVNPDPIVIGNHRTHYDGIVLSKTDPSGGLDTVEMGLMVDVFGEPAGTDGPLSTTVTSSPNLPVGTPLTYIDQSAPTPGTGDATLKFDAPDVNTPVVTRGSGLGDTGTAPPVCFVKGTMIACDGVERAVEDLRAGDVVMTQDRGLQKIRWISSSDYRAEKIAENDKLRPVLIKANSLGVGMPRMDLQVSRHHRVLVSGPKVEAILHTKDAFVSAHRLTELRAVREISPNAGVTYFHILLDHHEVLCANGLPSESLYLGEQTHSFLSRLDLRQIARLFPEVQEIAPARPIPNAKDQKRIVESLVKVQRKSETPLLERSAA